MTTTNEYTNALEQIVTDGGRWRQILNGPASGAGSIVDTEGGPVKTIARIISEVPSAQADRLAADASAALAQAQAGIATTQAGAASTSAAAAQTAQVAAEAAAAPALAAGRIYGTIALGMAAIAATTLPNNVFWVIPNPTDGIARMSAYQKTGASTSVFIADLGTGAEANRSSALLGSYPFIKSLVSTNAAGSADLFSRLLRGVIDVKLYGLPATDTYYIERLRRNVSGNWHIVVKRASDNASVLQLFAPLTEPTDPSSLQRLLLPPAATTGPFGYIVVRWSEFVAGAFNTGLTMTLSPDCLDRGMTTMANQMPSTAARLGNVPLTLDPAAFVTVNEATRTVSWPELRIVDGRANSSGYFKLAAGSVTFNAALQVAYLDLALAATYAGGAAIPASAVALGTYGIFDPAGTGYYGASHQFPIAWSPGAGRVDVNPMLRLAPAATAVVYRDDMVVKRDLANNIISIYIRANGNDAASLTYIHYRLYHHVASNADVWTLDGVWEVSRTGYESFTTGKELVAQQVELICALQEAGAGDFMGGRAHGDEVVTQTPTLLIDGLVVSLSSTTLAWYHAKEITFIQTSTLYRDGSLATPLSVPLAARKLWLTFRDGEMLADQRIEHLASYTLQAGYLAMLAPHRYDVYVGGTSEDNTSAQISGYYSDNVRMIPMDATAKQAGQVADDYVFGAVPGVTKVKLWGSYGVTCMMEVLDSSADILKSIFYINRTSYAYNKAYIGFIGGYSGNQSVTA